MAKPSERPDAPQPPVESRTPVPAASSATPSVASPGARRDSARYEVAYTRFDRLVIINADMNLGDRAMLEAIKTQSHFLFCPLSTCNRYVIMFNLNDLQDGVMDALKAKIRSKEQTIGTQYMTSDEAMIFLSRWRSGTLHKGRYLNDPFNAKTIQTSFDVYCDIVGLVSNSPTVPEFDAGCRLARRDIEREISALAADQEDAHKWLKTKKEELDRIRDLMRPVAYTPGKNGERRITPSLETMSLFRDAFEISSVLCGHFEKNKQKSEPIKFLYSERFGEVILKADPNPDLKKVKPGQELKPDHELFGECMTLRERVAGAAFIALVSNAKYRKSTSGVVKTAGLAAAEAFSPAIIALARRLGIDTPQLTAAAASPSLSSERQQASPAPAAGAAGRVVVSAGSGSSSVSPPAAQVAEHASETSSGGREVAGIMAARAAAPSQAGRVLPAIETAADPAPNPAPAKAEGTKAETRSPTERSRAD